MVKVKILIADDHRILRAGLRSLLEERSNVEVLAEADNGRAAVELTHSLKPDVVIMDVAMPYLNGVEATRQIHDAMPDVKVLALSMHSDRRFIRRMLQAGALGYLLKDCAFEELTLALDTVMAGQIYLSPGVTDAVVRDYMERLVEDATIDGPPLTPREREVLQLLAEGKSTKDTAALLHVSIKTIETHRKQIRDKLGLRSVAELTKYAVREGYTGL